MQYPTQRPTSTFRVGQIDMLPAATRTDRWQMIGVFAGAAISLVLGNIKGYNKSYWFMLPVFPVAGALAGRAAAGYQADKPNGTVQTVQPVPMPSGTLI